MTFGERLRYLREERELRQQDVAEYLNISTRMIGYYESNKHFPSDAKMIMDLETYFDVSVDYLFGISEVRNNAILNKFESLFAELSENNKKSALDYMNYLKENNWVFYFY